MTVIVGTSQGLDLLSPAGYAPVIANVDLIIMDPQQVRAPTALQVMVSGVDPGEQLTFSIDNGATIYTAYADAGGFLGQTSIPVGTSVGAGDHTLNVDSMEHGSDSETFNLRNAAPLFPEEQNPDADPVFIPGSTGRWVLQDVMPGGLGSWVMPINPTSMTAPHFSKSVEVTHTTARDGHYSVARGDTEVVSWTLQGYAPNADYKDRLKEYAELERRFYIIDHRGRAWKVALESCKFEKRKRQFDSFSPHAAPIVTQENNDEAANWTIVATILGQTWVTPVGA